MPRPSRNPPPDAGDSDFDPRTIVNPKVTLDARERAADKPATTPPVPTTNYQSAGFGRPFDPQERAAQFDQLAAIRKRLGQ